MISKVVQFLVMCTHYLFNVRQNEWDEVSTGIGMSKDRIEADDIALIETFTEVNDTNLIKK